MQLREKDSPPGPATRGYRLAPDVGRWRIALARVAGELRSPDEGVLLSLDQEVDEILGLADKAKGPDPSAERLMYGFVLSLLLDVVQAGGQVQVVDSEIYVSWPIWTESAARRALEQLRKPRPLADAERNRLRPMFLPSLSRDEVMRFIRRGHFWLEPADSLHPSGVRYGEAFSASLQLWTMPYRGRSGRLRRFVLVGQEMEVYPGPAVVGLIEIADDTPFNSDRDRLLGLRPEGFLQWLSTREAPNRSCEHLAARFRGLRSALLPITGVDHDISAEQVLANEGALVTRASGRSQTDTDFVEKKRIAYLVRLAHGEHTFLRASQGAALRADDGSLREALRALRDLSVPRIAMEVSICGALPPLSRALAGKLVVAFLAHPFLLRVPIDSVGSVVRQVFDVEVIRDLLPDYGLLGLTTKGLYPSHSALYNRAEVPGVAAPQRLRKIGVTRGVTTTLLGERTARLAQLVLDALSVRRQVSLTYGTGGAKRQRRIESAVISTGLPETFVHAGIQRPVYGLPLASNIGDVVWAHREPAWLVNREIDPQDYAANAVRLWRDRWLDGAARRLQPQEIWQGVLEHLPGD